jgi:hypothetical protein
MQEVASRNEKSRMKLTIPYRKFGWLPGLLHMPTINNLIPLLSGLPSAGREPPCAHRYSVWKNMPVFPLL